MKIVKVSKEELIEVLNIIGNEISDEIVSILKISDMNAYHFVRLQMLRDNLTVINRIMRETAAKINKGGKGWN